MKLLDIVNNHKQVVQVILFLQLFLVHSYRKFNIVLLDRLAMDFIAAIKGLEQLVETMFKVVGIFKLVMR